MSLQVFDALIILASFIVDLVFLKGLADFAIDDSIFILAFLLPWRVIRVVNSKLPPLTTAITLCWNEWEGHLA